MKRQNDKQQIAQLLNKFMAGETSLAEEQLLAQYFRTHDAGEDWAEYKQMFALFDSGEVDIEVKAKPTLVALRRAVAAVAASVLLLLAFHLSQKPEEEAPAVTYTATSSQSTLPPISQPIVEKRKETVADVAQPMPQPVKQHKRAVRSAPIPSKEGDVRLHDSNRSSASLSNQTPPPLEGLGEAFNRQDPFLLAAAQAQDIRRRGERLHHEIAQLMENP